MPSRKLLLQEKKLLQSIYFDEINYAKIKITNINIFSLILRKFSGITFGNKIIFSKKAYRADFSQTVEKSALLIHEAGHVWQYQNLKYWWFRAGLEHLKFGKEVYKYEIHEHYKLTDFRFEQQGEIFADYYRNRTSGNEIEAKRYFEVIYEKPGVLRK